jgi:hypothetical protein
MLLLLLLLLLLYYILNKYSSFTEIGSEIVAIYLITRICQIRFTTSSFDLLRIPAIINITTLCGPKCKLFQFRKCLSSSMFHREVW